MPEEFQRIKNRLPHSKPRCTVYLSIFVQKISECANLSHISNILKFLEIWITQIRSWNYSELVGNFTRRQWQRLSKNCIIGLMSYGMKQNYLRLQIHTAGIESLILTQACINTSISMGTSGTLWCTMYWLRRKRKHNCEFTNCSSYNERCKNRHETWNQYST